MLSVQKSKQLISQSTIKFVVRFLWNSKNGATKNIPPRQQQSENIALADALNLLVKSTEEVKRPSLYDSLTQGPVEEQLNSVKVEIPETQTHVSDQLIANILQGIKSSNIDSLQEKINYSQLYEMNSRDLSSYIAGITSEQTLFEILETFYNHKKLNIRVLTNVLLNKNLKHLEKSPISHLQLREYTEFNSLDITKLEIILLKKYHDLKQPLNVIRLLKQNLDSKYVPLIKSQELPPFYERIIWRFVFEYLKQYKELHYIEQLNNIKSSFIIWEASTKNSNLVARDILAFHKDLNELQKHFLKIASADNLSHIQLRRLKRMSIKYKISRLDPVDTALYEGLNDVLESEFNPLQSTEQLQADEESVRKVYV